MISLTLYQECTKNVHVPRMFAYDTNLTLSAKTLTELRLALAPELINLSCWLKANKLSLKVKVKNDHRS